MISPEVYKQIKMIVKANAHHFIPQNLHIIHTHVLHDNDYQSLTEIGNEINFIQGCFVCRTSRLTEF